MKKSRKRSKETVPQKNPVEKPKPSPGLVWEAWAGPGYDFEGYVVTETIDPNVIIAIIPYVVLEDDEAKEQREWGRMLSVARRIADDPRTASDDNEALDYSKYQRPDSPQPTPSDIYKMSLTPAGTKPPTADGWMKSPMFEPFPFCRYRLAHMIDDFNAMHFKPSDLAHHTKNVVGIAEDDEGSIYYDQLPAPEVFRVWQTRRRMVRHVLPTKGAQK